MGGLILTYICAEAEKDAVKRTAIKNKNLVRLFFMIEIFLVNKKMSFRNLVRQTVKFCG